MDPLHCRESQFLPPGRERSYALRKLQASLAGRAALLELLPPARPVSRFAIRCDPAPGLGRDARPEGDPVAPGSPTVLDWRLLGPAG
jgi:hypothetical protein